MQRPIQLLAVMPNEWLANLRDAVATIDIDISNAHDWQSAFSILRKESGIEVLLTASMLPDATWKEVLSDASHLQRPPQIVVAARYGDSSLWYDILEEGGYELVMFPFHPVTLQKTIMSAAVEYQLMHNMFDSEIALPDTTD